MAYQPFSVWEEHLFWLEMLQDHAHFIHDFLSAKETQWIHIAAQYIDLYQQLRNEHQALDRTLPEASPEMVDFARRVYPIAHGYFLFEGHLQKLRINNEVNLNLTPTYLNGTLSENQEYLRMLQFYMRGEVPPVLPLIDLLDLWLDDQLGHAALLVRALDGVELLLVEKINQIRQIYQAHIVKNRALRGYLRFTPPDAPISHKFARDIAQTVLAFNQVVLEVTTLYKGNEVLNQTTLRFLEHHFPESCYFLNKLTFYAPEIETPPCSLSKPSFQ